MSEATFAILQKKYGIKSGYSITQWIRKFGPESPDKSQIELEKAMKEQNQITPREQELELKIKSLEKELEKERLRTLALNTMIDIAERDLKIKVRKNSGAKQ